MLRLACIENPYFHRDSGRRSSDFWLQSVGLQSVQYVFAPRDNGHCRWTVFDRRMSLGLEVKGVQWSLGGVGNAEWTGVPLSILLDRARVKSTAREIILEGADRGKPEDPKSPPGEMNFARSIPMKKASDVLLAYKMNDVDLPAENGFPVRAIVPGWYAVASVKWLQRIIVTDKIFNGYYQTLDYSFWKRRGDNAELVPL